ncbi:hypothetical protein Tco_1291963 [Tanacetum coccineum]
MVQTTSPPPVSSIPDIQPTLPPSPQIPSPLYHDTEGPSSEPSYHMSPPLSHEPEFQASRSNEESEQLRKQKPGGYSDRESQKARKQVRRRGRLKKPKDVEGPGSKVPFETDTVIHFQASKTSKELQELADLEEAKRVQAEMDVETQRQIDLDALLARRLVEQEEEAAREALATEFDYIQARLNADQILAEKIQQEEREQYSIEERAKFLHDTIAAQRKFLAEQRSAIIRNKPPTISQLRNQMITYLKHVANKKHAELKSKSFEEIQVLYERYKKQDQTFVAIGSEEDERAIKKINGGKMR